MWLSTVVLVIVTILRIPSRRCLVCPLELIVALNLPNILCLLTYQPERTRNNLFHYSIYKRKPHFYITKYKSEVFHFTKFLSVRPYIIRSVPFICPWTMGEIFFKQYSAVSFGLSPIIPALGINMRT